MKKIRLWVFAAVLAICSTAAFSSCTANDDNPSGQDIVAQYIPQAPDYSDATMWVTADGDADGTGADVHEDFAPKNKITSELFCFLHSYSYLCQREEKRKE
jgi:hypothetical protein